MHPYNIYIAFFILIITTGCGYTLGQGGTFNSYSTISVPYVEGDDDGSFTAALIKQIDTISGMKYQAYGGDLLLLVQLVDFEEVHIGFRYDRNKENKRKNEIIPTETRLFAYANVTVVEAASKTVLMGPLQLSSSVDIDHDYYSVINGVNVFSLGQLTDIDEAFDAAYTPLNKALSNKIVDLISQGW